MDGPYLGRSYIGSIRKRSVRRERGDSNPTHKDRTLPRKKDPRAEKRLLFSAQYPRNFASGEEPVTRDIRYIPEGNE